jgi:hypothetical protein
VASTFYGLHQPFDPIASAKHTQKCLQRVKESLNGALPLDNVDAIQGLLHALKVVLSNIASDGPGLSSGLGHDVILMGFSAPTISIVTSLVLAIIFYISPQIVSAANGGTGDLQAIQLAALVPTSVCLVNFLVNMLLLLHGFIGAGKILRAFVNIQTRVLEWHTVFISLITRYSAQKRALTASIAGSDSPTTEVLTKENLAAVEGTLAELAAVELAQRNLLLYLQATIADGGGIRFLGVFRPGAASIGGAVAIMVSTAVLGLRLAASVYGSGSGV